MIINNENGDSTEENNLNSQGINLMNNEENKSGSKNLLGDSENLNQNQSKLYSLFNFFM